MKIQTLLFASLILFSACKNEKNETSLTVEAKESSIAEKIANANGVDNWKNVNEIQFTFNVDRPNSHFERAWTWNPKTDDITMVTSAETISYNRKSMDSVSVKADKGFINDKFWLLAPYNLVWDEGTTIFYQDSISTNLTNEILNKLTITYGNEGGYTPGDAYDFYYDKDFMVREWVFRKSNQPEPSMITTWEDYEEFNGLIIAKTHNGKDNSVKLYFTNIKVK